VSSLICGVYSVLKRYYGLASPALAENRIHVSADIFADSGVFRLPYLEGLAGFPALIFFDKFIGVPLYIRSYRFTNGCSHFNRIENGRQAIIYNLLSAQFV